MRARRPRPGWIAARIAVPAADEDRAIGAFWEAGCLGIEARSAARRPREARLELEAWFPGDAAVAALSRRVAARLRAAGVAAASRPRLRRVPDGRWVEAWQKSLAPMAIGRRILALPEGCRAPARTPRIVIRIPFGQAFGTGEHASTRLCLRLMERNVRAGDRVADLGTGTGILAVAAARLGAGRVLAVDRDPVAVRVARVTVLRNRTAAVSVRAQDALAALDHGPFDLALVNIGAAVIGAVLPRLAAALAPGGGAILAGFLIDDEAELSARAAGCGLVVAARLRSRPWSALLLRGPAVPARRPGPPARGSVSTSRSRA